MPASPIGAWPVSSNLARPPLPDARHRPLDTPPSPTPQSSSDMDAAAPRAPAPGITAPRYCSRCGTPLAETSSGRTRCDRLFRLREEAVEPPNLHARSLWSALGLYFVLLGASVALIASEWVLETFDLHSS